MSIILNEKKQAEEIIKNGEVGDKPASTLFLLARYYRQEERLSLKETILKLSSFMDTNLKNYNPVQWEDFIDDVSKKAMKKKGKGKDSYLQYPLKIIEKVEITSNELEKIKSSGDLKHQKILFTMLCFAKYYNLCNSANNGWANTEIREIYKTARVSVHYSKDKYLYLNDLENLGLIEFSKKNDNLNIRITFINSDDVILEISDFRELGLEYEKYIGNGIFINCEVCNRIVKKRSKADHSTKYCSECAKKVKNEQNKAYYKEKTNI